MNIKAIIFDLGGVLVNWNPAYLFDNIFDDADKKKFFFDNVCTPDWNEEQDAGRPIKEATELLVAQHPEWQEHIEAFYGRWEEMLGGPIHDTVTILKELKERGHYKLYALTNWSAEFKNDLGVQQLWGEEGYTTNERTGIRPTLEVNGIWGGYTGEGAKTVLPSKATAKISARLVPNQSSEKITNILLGHFRKIAPPYVTVNAFEHHGGEAYMTPIDSTAYKAAAKAVAATFGKEPIPVRGGGSIPICSILERELGIKIVFMGFGLDSDNLHSPNEKYNIENYYKGIQTIPYFHKYFAEMSNGNH